MEGISAKIREVYGLPSSFMIVANYHRIGSKHGEQVHSFSFTLENPTAHKKSRARKAPSKVKRDQQRRTAHIERLNSEDGIPPAVAVVAAPVSSNRPNERQQPLLVSRGNFPASPPVSVEIKHMHQVALRATRLTCLTLTLSLLLTNKTITLSMWIQNM